ncbi:histidine phosphatase family protein [Virgibacillus indicus]|uniref:Histidine phosphatase family protein n=1 Tax=Virgibacillus indicus TaxID=2024554 RepID=A0A265N766_9BACI|nr:histidine phosphatase family protein [Virgibacillus indicus]OZU87324.1 histidine phosphatase family protein [Virgibacillus indicus]
MDDVVAITLFRHGLTEENKRKSYLGWNDSPLSKEAIKTLTSYKFSGCGYDLLVSSDLQRCLYTIGLLFSKEKPMVLSEFREMNFGMFQGKSYKELRDVEEYQQWIDNMYSYTPPEGESFEQFTKRVERGWNILAEIILQKGARKPFVVTHGGVIRYLLSKFSPDNKEFWEWSIPEATGYELIFHTNQLRREEHCISLQAVPSMANENG